MTKSATATIWWHSNMDSILLTSELGVNGSFYSIWLSIAEKSNSHHCMQHALWRDATCIVMRWVCAEGNDLVCTCLQRLIFFSARIHNILPTSIWCSAADMESLRWSKFQSTLWIYCLKLVLTLRFKYWQILLESSRFYVCWSCGAVISNLKVVPEKCCDSTKLD